MIFMMPNAKLALSMAQVLFTFNENGLLPLNPLLSSVMEKDPLLEKLVQSALAIALSSYTDAISAPTKHRSIKDTKRAERRVDFRRRRVARVQAAARTEVIKRTLLIVWGAGGIISWDETYMGYIMYTCVSVCGLERERKRE